ncbi:YvrJ family protein [Clostridium pasteurianum]|uniref:YvrJ protein family n=1 Tax=Clostridium pasteurianum BC1 TaxID=86416 RepID=R4K5W9_CLOPA|nr:YvrJ family protein [Clostridium pasteurianum]AGK95934.1 hypothetical protein Clopa_0917 [Clostridium pasteurianum BC1]
MYDEIVKLINTVGFPIAVSLFLLIKLNGQLDTLIKSIHELKEEIAAVIKNQDRK